MMYSINPKGINELLKLSVSVQSYAEVLQLYVNRVKTANEISGECLGSNKDILKEELENIEKNLSVFLDPSENMTTKLDSILDSYGDIIETDLKLYTIEKSLSKGSVLSNKEEKMRQYAFAWMKKRKTIKEMLKSEGKNPDEIRKILSEKEVEFKKEYLKNSESNLEL